MTNATFFPTRVPALAPSLPFRLLPMSATTHDAPGAPHNVELRHGDLFGSEAQTLVNAVNCVGVMGKGIALQFKRRFPGMYQDYVARCDAGSVRLGEPYLWSSLLTPWVINFPTKGHWRESTRLEHIESGLEHLVTQASAWGVESLAVPALGCGEGYLRWEVVQPALMRHLGILSVPVEIYAPLGQPTAVLGSQAPH